MYSKFWVRNLILSSRSFPIYLVLDDRGNCTSDVSDTWSMESRRTFKGVPLCKFKPVLLYNTYPPCRHVASRISFLVPYCHTLWFSDTPHTQTYPTQPTAELVHATMLHAQTRSEFSPESKTDDPVHLPGRLRKSNGPHICNKYHNVYVTMSKATTAEVLYVMMSYCSTYSVCSSID